MAPTPAQVEVPVGVTGTQLSPVAVKPESQAQRGWSSFTTHTPWEEQVTPAQREPLPQPANEITSPNPSVHFMMPSHRWRTINAPRGDSSGQRLAAHPEEPGWPGRSGAAHPARITIAMG